MLWFVVLIRALSFRVIDNRGKTYKFFLCVLEGWKNFNEGSFDCGQKQKECVCVNSYYTSDVENVLTYWFSD